MSTPDKYHQEMDAEANEFAFELLMPSEWLRRDCENLDLFDHEAIKKIADKYKVSIEMLIYRLGAIRGRK